MITAGNYSLEILRSDKSEYPLWVKDGDNYFRLPDGAEYALRLSNDGEDDANVTFTFDGKTSKKIRVEAGTHPIIKSLEDYGPAFRFRNEESWKAYQQGHRPGASMNGVIAVKFVPERKRVYEPEFVWAASQSPFGFGGPSSSAGRSMGSALPQSQSLSASRGLSAESFKGPSSLASAGFAMQAMPSMSAPLSVKSGVTTFEGSSNQVYRRVRQIEEDESRAEEIVVRLVVDSRREPIVYQAPVLSPPSWMIPPRLD